MIDLFQQSYYFLLSLFHAESWLLVAVVLFPFILFLELPFYIVVGLAAIRDWLNHHAIAFHQSYNPKVTCIICCYNEKEEIAISLQSIIEQRYKGQIEILLIFDNGKPNSESLLYIQQYLKTQRLPAHIQIKIIVKRSRGGHASSLNLGLSMASGEILFLLDADTSLNNSALFLCQPKFVYKDQPTRSG